MWPSARSTSNLGGRAAPVAREARVKVPAVAVVQAEAVATSLVTLRLAQLIELDTLTSSAVLRHESSRP